MHKFHLGQTVTYNPRKGTWAPRGAFQGVCDMRLAKSGLLAAAALVSMAQTTAEFAASEIAGQFTAASLPNPTLNRVVICHGFACKFRTVIAFGTKDHAELRKIMAN